ncbi:polyprenyl synthetase family protein [Staphylospora marina]|uniref:polyprenyl synthetase family protein n=1 Tax=Staphylospora marina TaxID=2490858 RepID=UPI001F14EB8C|nr:farnesyl diphosphate synthase [Staphylospora marina]
MQNAIVDYIRDKAALVHGKLDEYGFGGNVPPLLLESMRYSLLAGGKRIRPVLVLATCQAVGGNEEHALPFACAIEMIHTYSLIHDDLPCMDDDDYRRGKPTNHKIFGEAQAILAGDALLTESFGLMASGARAAGLPADVALTVLEEASRYAGARGMVAGQVLDMMSENKNVTLKEVEEVHRRKTGDLIAFSVRTGARVGGVRDGELLESLTRFAYGLGLAFQIQDDILDVIGDQKLLGKPVGSDEANKKATYPALIGLERSKRLLEEVISDAKSAISNRKDLKPDRLLDIADFLLSRDR